MTECKTGFLVERRKSLPNIPIRELDLPTRAKNALLGGGIQSLSDMADWRESELLTLPHCGPATIDALRTIISRLAGASRQRQARRWAVRGMRQEVSASAR
jgi:DNA-directed RNA polymerase alpha subunit